VAWEQALVNHAAAKGWPVAVPIAAGSSTVMEQAGRLWAAAPFLPGQSDVEPTPKTWLLRGELLARLHQDLSDFPLGQRPGFGTALEVDAWIARAGAPSFDEAVEAFANVQPDLAAEIRRRSEESTRELARLGYSELPQLPIQGDFKDLNLLWSGGELTGLLDFDASRRDLHVYDLADVLVPFMPLAPEAAAALVAGYDSVRRLTSQERRLLAPLAKAKLLWWVSMLLGAWWASGEAPGGIQRTMMTRFPAVEAATPGWQAAWDAARRA
jgi:homoserine kinase type II